MPIYCDKLQRKTQNGDLMITRLVLKLENMQEECISITSTPANVGGMTIYVVE